MQPAATPNIPGVISADFYTSSYRVVGSLMLPPTGLFGLVNEWSDPTLEILDAHLARIHMPSKLVGHYESIRLVKAQIYAIALARRINLTQSATTPRSRYVPMHEYPVTITSAVYELQGTLESGGQPDFSTLMASAGGGEFVPLYDATLSAILIPSLQARCPAILFNRRMVDMLALLSQKSED